MTMHLERAWLSTTGKKKGKQKFASAEAKRRSLELNESWDELKRRHDSSGIAVSKKVKKNSGYGSVPVLAIPEGRNTTAHIKSVDTGGGSCSVVAPKIYTGDKILGIATMHKSNMVPVFSNQEAVDISKMRRG